MSGVRLIGSSLLVLSLAACSSHGIPGPPAGFPHAAVTPACGPADGAASAIYLASNPVQTLEPRAPYVRIYVWEPLGRLAGRTWVLTGSEPGGSAWFHPTATDSEGATRGRVAVTAVASDNTVEGTADLTFPSLGRVRGGFRAAWVPGAPLCG